MKLKFSRVLSRFFFLVLLLASCKNSDTSPFEKIGAIDNSNELLITQLRVCQPANSDELYDFKKYYIEDKRYIDNDTVYISFRVKDFCCCKFKWDYEIEEDSLKILMKTIQGPCVDHCFISFIFKKYAPGINLNYVSIQPIKE